MLLRIVPIFVLSGAIPSFAQGSENPLKDIYAFVDTDSQTKHEIGPPLVNNELNPASRYTQTAQRTFTLQELPKAVVHVRILHPVLDAVN